MCQKLNDSLFSLLYPAVNIRKDEHFMALLKRLGNPSFFAKTILSFVIAEEGTHDRTDIPTEESIFPEAT